MKKITKSEFEKKQCSFSRVPTGWYTEPYRRCRRMAKDGYDLCGQHLPKWKEQSQEPSNE